MHTLQHPIFFIVQRWVDFFSFAKRPPVPQRPEASRFQTETKDEKGCESCVRVTQQQMFFMFRVASRHNEDNFEIWTAKTRHKRASKVISVWSNCLILYCWTPYLANSHSPSIHIVLWLKTDIDSFPGPIWILGAFVSKLEKYLPEIHHIYLFRHIRIRCWPLFIGVSSSFWSSHR